MLEKKNSLLVSRYIIEENEDDLVIFNSDLKNNNLIIKSVFKKLMGNYNLF